MAHAPKGYEDAVITRAQAAKLRAEIRARRATARRIEREFADGTPEPLLSREAREDSRLYDSHVGSYDSGRWLSKAAGQQPSYRGCSDADVLDDFGYGLAHGYEMRPSAKVLHAMRAGANVDGPTMREMLGILRQGHGVLPSPRRAKAVRHAVELLRRQSGGKT